MTGGRLRIRALELDMEAGSLENYTPRLMETVAWFADRLPPVPGNVVLSVQSECPEYMLMLSVDIEVRSRYLPRQLTRALLPNSAIATLNN